MLSSVRNLHNDPVHASVHAAFFGEGFKPRVTKDAFSVMGTRATLTVVGGPEGLVSTLRERLHELDRAWSRFIDDSEVSLLNHNQGTPWEVSADTRLLVSEMVEGYRKTDGAFDPTVLPSVVAEGYTRSLVHPERSTVLPEGAHRRGRPLDIRMDETSITVPLGTTLDSGGAGKGLAADLVANLALQKGALGILVDLGGDMKALGDSPRGDTWRVQIENPQDPTTALSVVEFSNRGIATSTSVKRRFEVDGRATHHLIDPTTGKSTESDTVQATVIADSATDAEIFTKVAFVRSQEELFRMASRNKFEAACLLTSGAFVTTQGWPEARD